MCRHYKHQNTCRDATRIRTSYYMPLQKRFSMRKNGGKLVGHTISFETQTTQTCCISTAAAPNNHGLIGAPESRFPTVFFPAHAPTLAPTLPSPPILVFTNNCQIPIDFRPKHHGTPCTAATWSFQQRSHPPSKNASQTTRKQSTSVRIDSLVYIWKYILRSYYWFGLVER